MDHSSDVAQHYLVKLVGQFEVLEQRGIVPELPEIWLSFKKSENDTKHIVVW
jgi:hypothetical protein